MNIFLAALLLSATHAEIVELSGNADVRATQNEDFHHAKKGEDVIEGSRVRTGEKSEIVLRFTDGSTLTVSERSSMLVTHVTSQERERSAVVLFFGKLWAKVAKQSQPAFDVATPNAVAGVRGTEFETIVGDDGEARVVVKEGRVAVSDDASEKSVDPGESVDASPDGVFAPTTKRNEEKDFNREHRENIQKNGDKIAHAMSAKIDARKAHAQKLADRQRQLKQDLQNAESPTEQASIRSELVRNAGELSRLRERAEGGFGAFDHWADLSQDPKFRDSFSGAGFIREELKRLKKVHATFDALIAEGTDLSMKSMEKMLDDMHKGKPTIKDEKGSTKDLFDEH